jgi:phosphoenolpyruvate-protein phosphotransferase (PTS system enzyme I)
LRRLPGIGVSPGVVAGRAVVLNQRAQALHYRIAPARLEKEVQRLERARTRTREQLTDIRGRVARRRGPDLAALFDAQLLMLDDPMLVPRAEALVREERVNAEWAVEKLLNEFSAEFDEVADPYFRERKGDVADLVGRLTMNLRHGVATRDLLRELDDASILIADELTPSLAAQVDWTKVRGFATDAGSRTYHTAILARSLEVPAVVGLHEASRIIQAGQLVVLDGDAHELILDPDADTLARAERRAEDRPPPRGTEGEPRGPAVTRDGVRIHLEANIEFPDDLAAARYAGAEGIGLYRSEFLLTGAAPESSEDQQYEVYRSMLEGMAPGTVTVRTFDVDEEELKHHATRQQPEGAWVREAKRGRGQGLRGLRLSLSRPEWFRSQIRALLRAARHGSLRIMFPFVSGVDELRMGRKIVAEVTADLIGRGLDVPRVPVGVMIEIPAAAYIADLLAREADFFTLGTNDLIQYCLAVDRADERVSELYAPLHPAILRLILMVRRAAGRRRIPVSLCGEMAADPALIPVLVGLGLTDFSMTPGAIGLARQALADVRSDELRVLARRILRLETVAEIERELATTLQARLAAAARRT